MDVTVIIQTAAVITRAKNTPTPEQNAARARSIKDLIDAARSGLGLPQDVKLTRPSLDVPDDLQALENVVYEQVIALAAITAAEHSAPTSQQADILCNLVALAASPALTTPSPNPPE